MFKVLQNIPNEMLTNENFEDSHQNPDVELPKGLLMKINAIKGELGQMICVHDYLQQGYSIIPTGKGSDYYAVKIPQEIIDERNGTLIETKTGQARLSKRQKRIMKKYRRHNGDYRIYRVSDVYLKNFIQKLQILIPFLESEEIDQN